ncbi:MAG: serine dehydrogenasease, partial [Chloroflexota bacterium]
EEIARVLNDPDEWHSHGHGIAIDVLRAKLNLQIEDYDKEPKTAAFINEYHSLLTDYMVKRGYEGVVHSDGLFLPFM